MELNSETNILKETPYYNLNGIICFNNFFGTSNVRWSSIKKQTPLSTRNETEKIKWKIAKLMVFFHILSFD